MKNKSKLKSIRGQQGQVDHKSVMKNTDFLKRGREISLKVTAALFLFSMSGLVGSEVYAAPKPYAQGHRDEKGHQAFSERPETSQQLDKKTDTENYGRGADEKELAGHESKVIANHGRTFTNQLLKKIETKRIPHAYNLIEATQKFKTALAKLSKKVDDERSYLNKNPDKRLKLIRELESKIVHNQSEFEKMKRQYELKAPKNRFMGRKPSKKSLDAYRTETATYLTREQELNREAQNLEDQLETLNGAQQNRSRYTEALKKHEKLLQGVQEEVVELESRVDRLRLDPKSEESNEDRARLVSDLNLLADVLEFRTTGRESPLQKEKESWKECNDWLDHLEDAPDSPSRSRSSQASACSAALKDTSPLSLQVERGLNEVSARPRFGGAHAVFSTSEHSRSFSEHSRGSSDGDDSDSDDSLDLEEKDVPATTASKASWWQLKKEKKAVNALQAQEAKQKKEEEIQRTKRLEQLRSEATTSATSATTARSHAESPVYTEGQRAAMEQKMAQERQFEKDTLRAKEKADQADQDKKDKKDKEAAEKSKVRSLKISPRTSIDSSSSSSVASNSDGENEDPHASDLEDSPRRGSLSIPAINQDSVSSEGSNQGSPTSPAKSRLKVRTHSQTSESSTDSFHSVNLENPRNEQKNESPKHNEESVNVARAHSDLTTSLVQYEKLLFNTGKNLSVGLSGKDRAKATKLIKDLQSRIHKKTKGLVKIGDLEKLQTAEKDLKTRLEAVNQVIRNQITQSTSREGFDRGFKNFEAGVKKAFPSSWF